MFNIQKMMKQAQEVQMRLQEIQEKLTDIEIESESGGGLVKVKMTCDGNVSHIDIHEDLMGSDKETLEDLLVAAINNANSVKDERIKTETEAALKELGLPENMAGAMGGSGGGLPF
jgi:DNA-binding YbaB/EbfC family protein